VWNQLRREGQPVAAAGGTAHAGRRHARRPPGRRPFITTRPGPIRAAPDLVQAELHASPTERAVGRRLHLRADLVGDGVHRLRVRRVLPAHRRLAHGRDDADRAAPRRARDGAVDPGESRRVRRGVCTTPTPAANTSRSATRTGSLDAGASRRSAPSATATTTPWPRVTDRALQDRMRPPRRPVARRRRPRARHAELGPLVQRDQAPQRHRLRPTDRVRARTLPSDQHPASNRCRENPASTEPGALHPLGSSRRRVQDRLGGVRRGRRQRVATCSSSPTASGTTGCT
jgi:hypothetical protein